MKKETRYQQLSYEDRVKIETLLRKSESVRSIARSLGRSPNTIAREVREKKVRGNGISHHFFVVSRPSEVFAPDHTFSQYHLGEKVSGTFFSVCAGRVLVLDSLREKIKYRYKA